MNREDVKLVVGVLGTLWDGEDLGGYSKGTVVSYIKIKLDEWRPPP